MAIRVACTCGKSYEAPVSAAGKVLKCSACGVHITVPRVEVERAKPAPPRPPRPASPRSATPVTAPPAEPKAPNANPFEGIAEPARHGPKIPSKQPFFGSFEQNKRQALLLAAIAGPIGLLILLGLIIAQFAPDVVLYVDNLSGAPIEVTIDEDTTKTIHPGETATLRTKSGQRRISVKQEGKVIFAEEKNLREDGKYLLNPDGKGLYARKPYSYGLNLGFGGIETPASAYHKLAQKIQLVPREEAWVDVSNFDFVLEAVPDQVEGEMTASRTALTRIREEDYQMLLDALEKKDVTKEDYQQMKADIERLLNESMDD